MIKPSPIRFAKKAYRRVFPRRFVALNDIDKFLAKYLPLGGFFVELGANDGIKQSNTYHLEKYKGWRGILIEPIPELAELCKKNRPNSRVFQCACVDRANENNNVKMVYCNLMSFVKGAKGGVEEEEDFLKGGLSVQKNIESYEVSVPGRTLSSIIDECGSPDIDLLSLDVEGYENQVLDGLDFDKHLPRLILMEISSLEETDKILNGRYRPIKEFPPKDILFENKSLEED